MRQKQQGVKSRVAQSHAKCAQATIRILKIAEDLIDLEVTQDKLPSELLIEIRQHAAAIVDIIMTKHFSHEIIERDECEDQNDDTESDCL